jgi:hypothetical protein
VLVDALPVLGEQMVNSLIGLFCGVFGNAPEHRQLTHGLFDDVFADLGATGDLFFHRSHTTTVGYDNSRELHQAGDETVIKVARLLRDPPAIRVLRGCGGLIWRVRRTGTRRRRGVAAPDIAWVWPPAVGRKPEITNRGT